AVQRVGAGLPVNDVRLLADYVTGASADTRFALFVLGALAMLALVLAGIGGYAGVAYATARRTREIAVRLALGADPRRIVSLVMRQGAGRVGAGPIVGVGGGRVLTGHVARGYLAGLLFRVTEDDVVPFACVAAALPTVALAATAIPALRAARVD